MGYTGYDRYSTYMPRGRAASRAAWLRSRRAQQVYESALKNKYKPNNKSIEIIGVRDPALTHITTDSVPGTLTQTTFDTTSRADSAQILLTNATGASKVIIAAWIRGKPVTRISDGKPMPGVAGGPSGGKGGSRGGYLHDKYVDYERIAQDGDITFETGNNFMVTADQVNKLADYYWKLNRTKKHIYTLSLVGFQSWFEPGEWYTLQIGGVGEAEYIDSTVECFDVRCSLSAGEAPSTSVSFREVEESWKFDSNEVARQIAAGDFIRKPSVNVVTVAPQYHVGNADKYCDGNDDQEEINSAIEYVYQIGGGTVRLPNGAYDISSSISLYDNVSIVGDGAGTQLNVDRAITYVLQGAGTAATHLTNISVTDLMLYNNDYTYGNTGIRASFIDGLNIKNVTVMGFPTGIDIGAIRQGFIETNSIVECGNYGIHIQDTATNLSSIYVTGNDINNVRDVEDNGHARGILVSGFPTSNVNIITISNNSIRDVAGAASGYTGYGIYISGAGIVCANNRVVSCVADAAGAAAFGYFIATGSTNCVMANNYAFGNGLDTGLANTNSNNFKDNGTDTQWAG